MVKVDHIQSLFKDQHVYMVEYLTTTLHLYMIRRFGKKILDEGHEDCWFVAFVIEGLMSTGIEFDETQRFVAPWLS